MSASDSSLTQDGKVVGLVGSGHFFSHFYGLCLPPLFPLLKTEFDVSYAELGLLVSAFSLSTGIVQIPVGFLVDRFQPGRILALGVALHATAILLIGLTSSYGAMLALVVLAGIANSVYHPAGYAILSAKIRHSWQGRAFSIYTFAGHFGWAAAPVVIGTAAVLWDWRSGLVAVGVVGLATAAMIAVNLSLLDVAGDAAVSKDGDAKPERVAPLAGLRLLFTLPILTCFAFYALTATAMVGFNTFFVAAVVELHGLPLTSVNTALAAFLVGSAIGILAGGVIADRTTRHDLVVAVGFGLAGVLIVIAGASGYIALLMVLLVVAGLARGIVPPSRDLIVRAVTPDGSTGKVFAFVSTGLNVGGVISPLAFGWIMDAGFTPAVFWLIAVFLFAAILAAGAAQRVGRQSAAAAAL